MPEEQVNMKHSQPLLFHNVKQSNWFISPAYIYNHEISVITTELHRQVLHYAVKL